MQKQYDTRERCESQLDSPQPHPVVASAVDETSLPSDRELLHEYATAQSDAVFSQLVARHVDFVYSSALRQVPNHAMAQDVTQAVFIILARKAALLRRETVLAGWLFCAVRYAALDACKIEVRRKLREEEAVRMQLTDGINETGDEWERLQPLLDEALAKLGAKDRNAILLRFFEKKSFGEIGEVLGGNENSARVRVVRAVEKLRRFFNERGIAVSAVALSSALLSNAAQAAPQGLISSLVDGFATHAATAALTEAAYRRSVWRRVKFAAAAVLLLLCLVGTIPLIVRQRQQAQAAEVAAASRAVREMMINIERTFTSEDPNGFIALIHFGNGAEEQFRRVLADYIRNGSLFRRAMQEKLNARRRPFDATFRELCIGQPPVRTHFIAPDRAATNIMTAKYPLYLVKVEGVWKWDLFTHLPREVQDDRMDALSRKSRLMESVTRRINGGEVTNVVEILQMIEGTHP